MSTDRLCTSAAVSELGPVGPLGSATEDAANLGSRVRAMALAPEGDAVAVAGSDASITVWRLSEPRALVLKPGTGRLELAASSQVLAMSIDGRHLLSASSEGNGRAQHWSDGVSQSAAISLSETVEPRCQRPPPARQTLITQMTFSRDGRYVAFSHGVCVGIRDMSIIETPPKDRLSIQTNVVRFDSSVIERAIRNEMARAGQVYFVHNRVQDIEAVARKLRHIVPEATIAIGHGQMHEGELERVMVDFVHGRYDILLATTIVESGLDIPNANTIFIDEANRYGLADLHQLRGRVGRYKHRAYCYLLVNPDKSVTPNAARRLRAIEEFSDMGAGFSIAMRDLEIRGAGELLGTRQHGHIQAVGFHLYTRLLADAVRQIRRLERADGEKKDRRGKIDVALTSLTQPISMPVNVDLPLAVGIPANYIADQDLRLRLYRRIADLRDETEIDALSSEFQDRFGELPEMVDNLFYQMRVKLRAEKAGLSAISWENGQIVLRYPPLGDDKRSSPEDKDGRRLPDLGPGIRGGRNAYWCAFGRDDDWEEKLLEVLERLNEN